MSEKSYKKFDTYAWTIYMVRLATDPKAFDREDKGADAEKDVVLTFCDNSRIESTEELWVDARVIPYHNDLALRLKKGDTVQVMGKLRFKRNKDGTFRGKIYDARLATMAGFERGLTEGDVHGPGPGGKDPVPPAFE